MLGMEICVRLAGALVLDVDDRRDCILRLVAEVEVLDVRPGIHVDVQGRLRNADLDLRPPIGLAGTRLRSGLDVKDVTGFFGQLLNIGQVSSFLAGSSLGGRFDIRCDHGADVGHDAEGSVFAEDGQDPNIGRHSGERCSGSVREIHERAEIFAGDVELERALHGVGHDLGVLDDAVHDDLRQAAEVCDEDDAHERSGRSHGEQEKELQRGPVREREAELEAALRGRGDVDVDGDQRVHEHLGHRGSRSPGR